MLGCALLPILFHFQGIARLMILDLKLEELVNGCERFGMVRCDVDAPAAFDVFKLVFNLRFQLLHGWRAGRSLSVNQHGSLEIAI